MKIARLVRLGRSVTDANLKWFARVDLTVKLDSGRPDTKGSFILGNEDVLQNNTRACPPVRKTHLARLSS